MVDDDEPKLPLEPAPAGRQADDQQPEAEPTEPPEGEQPEGEETETKAPADEEDIGDADDEQDDEDDDEEEEVDAKPKPKRLERYRREAERLKAENAALRSRTDGAVPSDQAQLQRAFEYAVWQEIGDPPNENDPQFAGNYVALERARQAYEFDRRQVTRDVRKKFAEAIRTEQDRVSSQVAEHKERVQRLKRRVKDYDEVMAKATLPVAPHVERLLLASKKSDRLGYALGMNQAKLAQLNRMSSEEAAREIGRLEGRLSLPQAKPQTQARKPITPLKGSGASPPSAAAARDAWLKKQYGDRF